MAPKGKRPSRGLKTPTSKGSSFVKCPACKLQVFSCLINDHLDEQCPALVRGHCEAQVGCCNDLETSSGAREHSDSLIDAVPSPKEAKSSDESHGKLAGDMDMNKKDGSGIALEGGLSTCKLQKTASAGTEGSLYSCKLSIIQHTSEKWSSEMEASTLITPKSNNAYWKSFSALPVLKAPKGHMVVEDFISEEEEDHIVCSLDMDLSNPWKLNRVNGLHKGKAYGVVTDLKRRMVQPATFEMPKFLQPIMGRMRNEIPLLKGFWPNETNSIDYRKDEGHWLKPHVDDRQLSGTVIVNLSLCGDCRMTYNRERGCREQYKVLLKQRSLQILAGECRYSFTHSIENQDLIGPRRVSLTFRQTILP